MKFTAGELNGLMSAQEAHMMDTCLIAEPAKTTGSYNLPVDGWNWDDAEESDCGLDTSPSKELLDQVPTCNAVMRLPMGTVISAQARVRVTHRFSVPQVPPITYDVIGTPRQGASGLQIWLKNVTDGSDG